MVRARSVRRSRHDVPLQRTALIGREHDVARVRHLILGNKGRLVTLTGAGGCGKTRLALAVAAELTDSFQEGARLIQLASVADPLHVPQAVASALGVRDRAGRSLLDSLAAYLAPREILLVLDNCEHLIAAAAELADHLLEACASVSVLATSREPLRIAGEVTWRVPSLAVPDLRVTQSPADLLQISSVRLFVERALAVQPLFKLTPQNASTVAAICARLEGLPLAIELAAAWERALGVEEILTRLADTFQLLVGGSRTSPTRQQTLWATLDWSHALLASPEQALFRRLAVFAGGWTLTAAEAVCGGGEVAHGNVLSLLTRLVDCSLALEEETDGRARYRLLEPVRAFAAEHLARSDEAEATQRAHAMYFLERAGQLETSPGADPAEWAGVGSRLDELQRDYQNFRLALQWLNDHMSIDSALQLANALAWLWQFRGYFTEGRAWMSTLLQRPGGEARTRGRALGWAGNFALFQGDPAAARALHEQNLAIDEAIGDHMHVAAILSDLGRDALAMGDYEAAERLCADALNRFQALGDRGLQAAAEELWTLYTLGMAAYEQADWARAQAFHSRCVEQATVLGGGNHLTSLALYGLGRVAHQQLDYARARSLLEEALAIQRAVDDPAKAALTLVGLGQLLLDEHDADGARAAFAESLALFDGVGDQFGLARALDAFAGLAVVENQPERGLRLVGAAERLRAAGQTPLSPADGAELARRLQPARQLLGAEAAVALKTLGHGLSTPQAVALAKAGALAPTQNPLPQPNTPTASQNVLTPRECEVAGLVALGLSNRQISVQLLITRRTAAAHVEHILRKLEVTSRTQVGIWAAEHGLRT